MILTNKRVKRLSTEQLHDSVSHYIILPVELVGFLEERLCHICPTTGEVRESLWINP